MLLTIILVNYNVAGLIVKCIESFIQKIRLDGQYEIIVVDNNSINRDIELLPEKFPQVKFIFNKENLGFGEANNLAFLNSTADYVLYLNPDTLIIEDFINPIINFLKKTPNAGACGPMMLNGDLSYQNSTGIRLGYIYEISEAFMLINVLRFFYRKWLFKKMKRGSPVKVSWLSAACLIISRELFNKVGGFNSEFFLNYEDIDLCERIKKAGYKNCYFFNLKCIHDEHSSQKNNFEKFVLSRYQSRIIYARFHYRKFKRIIINVSHILGLLVRLVLVKFIYSGNELVERRNGYKKALRLYIE